MADWPPVGCQCHKRNRSCHLPSIGLQPPRPQYRRYRIVRKDAAGSQALSRIIKDRSVKKYYQTVCKGKILQESTLEGYLYKDERTNTVQVFPDMAEAPEDASFIKTIYTPSAVVGIYPADRRTGHRQNPPDPRPSGDTGHPLLGDTKYGDNKLNRRMQSEYSLHHPASACRKSVFPGRSGRTSCKGERSDFQRTASP